MAKSPASKRRRRVHDRDVSDHASQVETPLPNLLDPQPMVKINIGLSKFLIHKNFLCHYSRFFRTVFDGEPTEGEIQETTFGDESDVESFGLLVEWLYNQSIVVMPSVVPGELANGMLLLLDLWFLAEKTTTPKLQNHALVELDKLRVQAGDYLPRSQWKRIYGQTLPGSPLRRYVIATWQNRVLRGDPDDYPHELLMDIVSSIHTRPRTTIVEELSKSDIAKFFVEEAEMQCISRVEGIYSWPSSPVAPEPHIERSPFRLNPSKSSASTGTAKRKFE